MMMNLPFKRSSNLLWGVRRGREWLTERKVVMWGVLEHILLWPDVITSIMRLRRITINYICKCRAI